jgi:hypothetical protein
MLIRMDSADMDTGAIVAATRVLAPVSAPALLLGGLLLLIGP